MKAWQILERKEVYADLPWVRVFSDEIKLPSGRIIDNFYHIELPEYVMILGKDHQGKILVLKRFAPALRKLVWDFPSGTLEKGEAPETAAKRELLEETGYEAQHWQNAGTFTPNGSKGCGKGHFFIAQGLKKTASPRKDDTEVLKIFFKPIDVLLKEFYQGKIDLLATAFLITLVANSALLTKVNQQKPFLNRKRI